MKKGANMKGLLLFCIFLCFLSSPFLLAQEKRSDSIVAIVNDEIITYGELISKIKNSLQGIENSSLAANQKEYQKQQLMKIALRHLAEQKLVLQEAKRQNIKISDKTLKEQVDKELKEKGVQGTESEEIDLSDLIHSRMVLQELFQKKAGYSKEEKRRATIDTFVSPLEIRQYYEKNIREFTKESKIKTRIITLFYSKHGGKAQTLEKAQAIVKQLREGADFAELAKIHSNDPYSQEGGTWPRREKGKEVVWDFFGKNEALYKEVDDIAFSMKKGEISDPIPLENEPYCQIIMIEDLQEGGVVPFSEAQDPIRQKIRYEKMVSALMAMKSRLKERAFVWPAGLFDESEK